MWLTILFTLLNLGVAFLETRIVRIQSFDLAPILTIIAAQQGESVLLAALLINAPYAALSPYKLRFLWVTLPLTILIGYLSLIISSAFPLLLIYLGALALVALLMGQLKGGFFLFAGVNFISNLFVARLYGLLL